MTTSAGSQTPLTGLLNDIRTGIFNTLYAKDIYLFDVHCCLSSSSAAADIPLPNECFNTKVFAVCLFLPEFGKHDPQNVIGGEWIFRVKQHNRRPLIHDFDNILHGEDVQQIGHGCGSSNRRPGKNKCGKRQQKWRDPHPGDTHWRPDCDQI